MHRPFVTISTALVLLLAALQIGCAGDKSRPDDTQSVERAVSVPTSSDLFAAYAGWMPPDTLAVAIGETDQIWHFARDLFPPADRGGEAHFQAMRKDVQQRISDALGFDPSAAKAVVIAAGQRWQMMVLRGELDANFSSREAYEVEGVSAYRFELPQQWGTGAVKHLWVVPLEGSEGVVVFLKKSAFAAAAAARAGSAENLMNSPKMQVYQQLFKATSGGRVVLASHLDQNYQSMLSTRLPFPSPEAAVISLGHDVQAQFHGNKKALDGMQTLVEQHYSTARSSIEGAYANRQATDFAKALPIIMSYHVSNAYAEALRIERAEGVLSVNSALPRAEATFAMVGIVSAIAVPAFIKYIKRSKASEAKLMLSRLEQQAIAHYTQNCEFPATANPVPAGQPCCANTGPSGGAKWTAPKNTWQQPGWQALGFAPADPTYFAYQMINESSKGGADRLRLRAFADFDEGGARHTVEIVLMGQKDACTASAKPPVTSHEFE